MEPRLQCPYTVRRKHIEVVEKNTTNFCTQFDIIRFFSEVFNRKFYILKKHTWARKFFLGRPSSPLWYVKKIVRIKDQFEHLESFILFPFILSSVWTVSSIAVVLPPSRFRLPSSAPCVHPSAGEIAPSFSCFSIAVSSRYVNCRDTSHESRFTALTHFFHTQTRSAIRFDQWLWRETGKILPPYSNLAPLFHVETSQIEILPTSVKNYWQARGEPNFLPSLLKSLKFFAGKRVFSLLWSSSPVRTHKFLIRKWLLSHMLSYIPPLWSHIALSKAGNFASPKNILKFCR